MSVINIGNRREVLWDDFLIDKERTTATHVLNHPEKVKPATRDKVLKIIKEKGYKPNANARGLASRKSTTVAVVVPTLKRASISEMIQGIVDSANEYGYMIRLFVNDSTENEKDVWGNVIASSEISCNTNLLGHSLNFQVSHYF